MKISSLLSKERFVKTLKNLGLLRVKMSHDSILTFSALLVILFIAFMIRVFPLRWEIDLGASSVQLHLSEFDPYFQYRFTEFIVNNGFISWATANDGVGWIDYQRWYPGGLDVAKKGYPGLPMTAAFLYTVVTVLGLNIRLMDFCALFPAFMGVLASLALYFLGKDLGGKSVGLLGALFLALSPSYIQRTQVGFFDDETVGILALIMFCFLFLRAIEKDRPIGSSIRYAAASGIALGYFSSSWGAAYYAIGITTLFILASILLKRYSQRLLLSYSLTFGVSLFITSWVPKLGPSYLVSGAVLPVAGVFFVLCLSETFRTLTSTRWRIILTTVLLALLVGGFFILWQFGYMEGLAGKFISVINPLARAGSPLVESVAEHRISAWGSIYYEFGIGIIFFAGGFYFLLRDLNDKNLFLLIFSLTSLYFACSMVRLLVLMAPVFSLLAPIGISGILKPFSALVKEQTKVSGRKYGLERVGKEFSGAAVLLIFIVLMTHFAFPMPKVYRQAWSPVTITAASLPIAPNKPVQEWYDMLGWSKSNLGATTVVCSWWDYGYWLTVLGNVTSLADNATPNRTQIENIGFIFMANETQALKMLREYDAEYILVFTTLALGQTQDAAQTYANWAGYGEEGKWMWMARISGKAHDRFIENGFVDEQSSWTDESAFGHFNESTRRWDWNILGMSSTVYKLMAWGKHRWCEENNAIDPEVQYWNDNNLTTENIKPSYFEEAYFAGVDQGGYGGLVPLVCLYRVDWQKYYDGLG
ncbi:hypothetical protein GTO27_09695 [Candidatus Bathyarchaeota archaeon]|nr:hypothetical protein [Candidatus Bathyarchaeota archaeon]